MSKLPVAVVDKSNASEFSNGYLKPPFSVPDMFTELWGTSSSVRRTARRPAPPVERRPVTVENAAERPPILAITGIHKKFGRTHAVRGVDLVLREGEFVGLMGPNGAGKSTLIKILSGVYDADSGSISLDGQPVRNLAGRPEIGFVHQDLGLVDSMSVMDNLRLGARPLRLVGPVLHRGREIAFAQEALDRVGLDVALTANVGTLSPGEKALLAVARLLGIGARLIVVDETTSTCPRGSPAGSSTRCALRPRTGRACSWSATSCPSCCPRRSAWCC